MARPCSDDLRTRVVAAVEVDGLSRREVARRFMVMPSTVTKWVQRLRRTGSVHPAKMGRTQLKKLSGAWRDWLVARCHSGDFTLRGLVGELAAQGLTVSYRPVWAFVHAEGLTHKKRRKSRASKTVRTCSAGVRGGGTIISASSHPDWFSSTKPQPKRT
jgi:putative transposase